MTNLDFRELVIENDSFDKSVWQLVASPGLVRLGEGRIITLSVTGHGKLVGERQGERTGMRLGRNSIPDHMCAGSVGMFGSRSGALSSRYQ